LTTYSSHLAFWAVSIFTFIWYCLPLDFYFQIKSSPEEVQEQVRQVLDLMPFQSHWEPVDQLRRLGGITLLLQIIAFAYEWNYAGR
jgi:HIV-1 Vpr-binding protein